MDFLLPSLLSQSPWEIARAALDILVVYYVFYRLLLVVRGTRSAQVMVGLAMVVMAYIASRMVGFVTIQWVLESLFSSFIIVIVVVFQADIRRALSRFGRSPFSSAISSVQEMKFIEEIVATAQVLSGQHIGALMVIERNGSMDEYLEGSTRLDASLSWELARAIFHTSSPIHDGAVVIREGRLLAAGVYLPLSDNPSIAKELGTRHRAAIGLSEQTDAVIVVVSEETGKISYVADGKITRALDPNTLKQILQNTLGGANLARGFTGRTRAARARAVAP